MLIVLMAGLTLYSLWLSGVTINGLVMPVVWARCNPVSLFCSVVCSTLVLLVPMLVFMWCAAFGLPSSARSALVWVLPFINISEALFLMLVVLLGIVVCNGLALYAYAAHFSAVYDCVVCLALGSWLFGFYVLFSLGSDAAMVLLPLGVPMGLASFMTLIEMVSILVRPVTLSVRLTANITAGHLLLHLFGVIGMGWLLLPLELLVAGVQAYVFGLLIITYYEDVL